MVSLFIYIFLLQMGIFQAAVYRFVDYYILEGERYYAREAARDVSSSLSEAQDGLSLSNLADTLYATANSDYLIETPQGFHFLRSDRDVTNMLYFNQDIYIYDTANKLLFTTDEHHELAKLSPLNEVINMNWGGREGYVLTVPVVSEVTQDRIGYVQIFHDLTLYNQLMTRVMIFLVVFEVLGVILAAVVVAISTRKFLNPISRLHEVMSRIARRPNQLSERSEVRSGDEIEDLSRIFDGMLDRIEDHSNLQSRFISDVSHELRTPLAVVEGHLNMLRRWGKDDPLILEESLVASHEETKRMGLMIQDMLDLVRLQATAGQYKGQLADVREVANTVMGNFSLIHPEASLSLIDDINQSQVSFYRPHLEQALTILLDNAVKYSSDQPQVVIALSERGGRVSLAVRDQGMGIAPEELGRIFERFYRTDQSRTKLTSQKGLGIGLSILSHLTTIYDADLAVDSQLGQGTTFTLTFQPPQAED